MYMHARTLPDKMMRFLANIFGAYKLRALVIVLAVSSIYLYVFPSPTLVYIAVVLLHAGLGTIAGIFLVVKLRGIFSLRAFQDNSGWLLIFFGALVGTALFFIGTSRPQWNWMYAHIALSFAGVAVLASRWAGRKGWMAKGHWRPAIRVALFLGLAAACGLGGWKIREGLWLRAYQIVNPSTPPASMEGEGDGPDGPFFPSSAQTANQEKIPGKYFMESNACERCHRDIYRQWYSSVHHFSSFNNQWYRKSIEYMQDVVGVKPSKWCAGCHDPSTADYLIPRSSRL